MNPTQEKRSLFERFGRHINRGQIQYLRAGHLDVIEGQRQGIRFKDPFTGKEMVDCFTSAGCFNVGRRNPEVMKALNEASEALDMGSHCLASEAKIELARELARLAPGDLNRVLFASGGGEALDCAIKLARGATKRRKILATIKGYHGHTGFALSANGKEHYREHFEPLMPGFEFLPFNDLEAMDKAAGGDTAAILLEPVQGEAGIFVASSEYIQGLRRLCSDKGILLIFDEVQTGFGRTGKLFAAEHYDVVPDILCVAKSLGGGLFPNGAVLYRDASPMTDFVDSHPLFHETFGGGSDLGCRVSLAVLNVLVKQDLPAHAARVGAGFKDALEGIQRENPRIIKEVRGLGLMLGIEYIHEFMGPMMSDALAKQGVFAAYSGNAPQVMRFMMPIVATEEDVDWVVGCIRRALRDMRTLLPLALPAAKIPGVLKLLNNERVQTVAFNAIRSVQDVFHTVLHPKKGGGA